MFNKRLEKPTYMDYNLIEFLDIFEKTFCYSCPNLVIADVSGTNINHNFWIINEHRYDHYYRNCYNNKINFNDYNLINLALLDNFTLNTNITYEENILTSIKLLFKNDDKKIKIVHSSLVYNFFDVSDLEFIINNKI